MGITRRKGNDMRKNLKEARQKAGMTQKQVAEYLGISDKAYQKIEYGTLLGKIKHWDRLEDLFGINQRVLRQLQERQDVQQGNQ